MAEPTDQRSDPSPTADLPPARPVRLDASAETRVRDLSGPAGSGPPLVLLHGLTATADLGWFAAYEPLAARRRVVAPDLRGHGGGPAWDGADLGLLGDDVAALVRGLDLGPVVLVGYSMGGAVAQQAWVRHPDLVAGLVLCATALDYRERTAAGRFLHQPRRVLVAAIGRWAPRRVRAALTDRLRARSTASLQAGVDATTDHQRWAASELDRSDPFEVAAAGAVLRRYRAPAGLGRIDVPVAVVVTTEDEVVPTVDQLALLAALPAGTSRHDLAAGHGAFVEDPDRFVAALDAAVADVLTRAAPR